LAVLALAVLGTAGAFAYRAVYGNSGSGSAPPVIMASPAPNKVVPAGQSGGDPQANKLIYDRIGERSQDEKVISREEQPVDVKPAAPARVVFPNSPGTAAAPAAPPVAPNEPKRVKTVAIPAGGPAMQPDVRAPAAPASRASAQNAAPAASAGSAPARAPVAPPPVTPQASTSTNAPLSLAPQNSRSEPAPAPAAAPPAVRTATASPPPPRPTASSSGDGTGGFHVQVSSQRSESDAQASFRALQAKFPNVLGSWQPVVRRADLGEKGVYYRTMVGPFSSLNEATDMCGELKSAGGQCIVQRN
jgi:SPOR domain